MLVVNLLLPSGDIVPFHLLRGIGLRLGAAMKIHGIAYRVAELYPKANTVRLDLI